ncbi:MAG: trypsin-like peptidase domain-containing protein [Acholeplasmataceae bacterium]
MGFNYDFKELRELPRTEPYYTSYLSHERLKRQMRVFSKFRYLLLILLFIVSVVLLASCKSMDLLRVSSLRLVVSHESSSSFGSAIIYDEDDTYYYALTNDHVVDDSVTINALDYENNLYDVEVVLFDTTVDLAIIMIEKQIELYMLEFADEFSIGQEVIAVGYPSSIFKESYGLILNYNHIDYDINTKVIIHSAEIDHGSSGGVLVNNDYQIIGINFAAYFDGDTYLESYAIPLETIIEFVGDTNG